jgi:hypothetical protein
MVKRHAFSRQEPICKLLKTIYLVVEMHASMVVHYIYVHNYGEKLNKNAVFFESDLKIFEKLLFFK